MLQKLHQLWYIDLEARRRFQVWTMLVAFAYGIFNSIVLRRTEKQVTWETLGAVVFLTSAFSAFYCLQKNAATKASKGRFTYAHLSDVFHQNRRMLEVGLASTVVVLLINVVSRFPNSRVQAASVDIRLSRAFSRNQFDTRAINEVAAIFQTAAVDRLFISPRLVTVAGRKLEGHQENPDAWPAWLALLSYRSGSEKETAAYPPRECISLVNDGVPGVPTLFDHVKIIHCTQVIDRVEWKDVLFEDSTIVYHGGPVKLQNVQFKRCQFNFDYTPESQELAKALTTPDSVTITIPGLPFEPE